MQLHEFSLFSQQAIARNPAVAGALIKSRHVQKASMNFFNCLVYLYVLMQSFSELA
jgi:hypothetical protein